VMLTARVTVSAVIEYNYKDDMIWSPWAAIFFAHREVGNTYRTYGSRAMQEQLPRGVSRERKLCPQVGGHYLIHVSQQGSQTIDVPAMISIHP